jgi:thioredoxin 1
MLLRKLFAILALAFTLALPGLACATEYRPYDQAAFEQAKSQNKPVIVFVHAPWCPVCKAQMKTFDRVTTDAAYKDLVIFRIDFDTQPLLWKSFGATMQSTLIGYHGTKETGRIAHDADPAKVINILHATLG